MSALLLLNGGHCESRPTAPGRLRTNGCACIRLALTGQDRAFAHKYWMRELTLAFRLKLLRGKHMFQLSFK
jgi:hypothetical protein